MNHRDRRFHVILTRLPPQVAYVLYQRVNQINHVMCPSRDTSFLSRRIHHRVLSYFPSSSSARLVVFSWCFYRLMERQGLILF